MVKTELYVTITRLIGMMGGRDEVLNFWDKKLIPFFETKKNTYIGFENELISGVLRRIVINHK
jgi:hypothetical protein